jgi:hypothetical protein
MRTRLDIKTKLQPMLMAVGTSTYFTPTRVNSAIDDAYLMVASLKQWADIKKGFVTNTLAGEDYYDYPPNCQTESIFKISVDSDSKYEKMDFEDFMRTVENTTAVDPNLKLFSEYGRQIFIYPTPTTTGVANLILWGIIQAAPLTSDTSTTMFTDWADVLNEAILQYAYSDLIQNLDPDKSMKALARGELIVNREYKKIADRLQRKHKDMPQFIVPDFFRSSNSDNDIGNFRED